MLVIDHVIGSRVDPDLSERIHELEHRGAVDVLTISASDLARRRFRATTTKGVDVAIALPRDQPLFDGAVLLLDTERALVVRAREQAWLQLKPRSIADAIELGFLAGHLHWRVEFEGEVLLVALEAPLEDYLSRLERLLASQRVLHSLSPAARSSS